MNIYTGKEFNKIFSNLSFYKLLNENFTHHNFTYKNGLNVDIKTKLTGQQNYFSGLHFTNLYAIQYWIGKIPDAKYVVKIIIPEDATLFVKNTNGIYCSDMLYLDFTTMINIEDVGTLINTQEEWNKCISIYPSWILFIPSELENNFLADILDNKKHIYKNNDYTMMRFDKNQSDDVCRNAILYDYRLFRYIKNPTEELCIFALAKCLDKNSFPSYNKKNFEQIEYVVKYIKPEALTPKICEFIVKIFPEALMYIHPQTLELCEIAIYYFPQALKHIQNKTFELCKLAIQYDGKTLEYIDDDMFDVNKMNTLRKLAVKQNPIALKFIKPQFQNEKLCQDAIDIFPCAIEYVAEQLQTENLCMNALRQDIHSFAHIKNKTYNICVYAIRNNGYNLNLIKKQNRTEELCKLAVASCGCALQFVPNQTWKICKIAVKNNINAIKYVRNYSYRVMLLPLSFM